jgi:hypothetical protein
MNELARITAEPEVMSVSQLAATEQDGPEEGEVTAAGMTNQR